MDDKEQHMSTATISTFPKTSTTGVHRVLVPSAQPRLRLTRRGRLVFTSLAAVPVVAGVLLAALNGGMAIATSSSAPLEQITVGAGQSLWQLAEQIAPEADPREVVSDIRAVNQLSSAGVQAGQRISLPAEYAPVD
jgi:hypothetical protein